MALGGGYGLGVSPGILVCGHQLAHGGQPGIVRRHREFETQTIPSKDTIILATSMEYCGCCHGMDILRAFLGISTRTQYCNIVPRCVFF